MKFILFLTFCSIFVGPHVWSQKILSEKINYDAKIYKILLKELKTAEKLERSEPSTANLFRVFATRVEVLKFLKSKNVEDLLKDPNSSNAKQETLQIQKFYEKTKIIGFKIDKDTAFKERGKFMLLFGLMQYEFEEKNKDIPKYLSSSFAILTEGDLKHLAASKLGDYYFNLPDFNESAKYYREAIRLDPQSEWKTRHLYNLGWCNFKLEKFSLAIKLLLNIYNGAKTDEDKKDYYYQQAIQKIPHFYLYDNAPDSGYEFVKRHNGADSQEMINFLKEVYNKGFFDKIDDLVIDVENTLDSQKKYKSLLDLQLEIYFNIASREYKKSYAMLARMRKGIAQGDARKILTSEKKLQFIADNKNLLNQHLQVVNRKTFDPARNLEDKNVQEDAVDVLRLLISMDPNNTVSYRLKLAQLYNKTGQREQAMKMLWEDYLRYGGVNNPEAGPYLAEILAVIDAMGDSVPTENVERVYSDYLKVGKDQNIRKVVYLKYFDFYFNRGDYKKAVVLMKKHQKEFPSEGEDRRKMFAKVLNQSLKQKDKELFDTLREHSKIDVAVNTNQPIMRSVNGGHNTFLLEKVNKSLTDEKADKSVAASKLAEIFRSNSIDRGNQLISGFNAGLIFITLGNTNQSSAVYNEFIEQLGPQEYKEYHDKLSSIAENQLLLGQEDYGLNVYQRLIISNCKNFKAANPSDVLRVAEILILKNSESAFLDLLSMADKCQWSEELRKKVHSFVIEYLPWNDSIVAKRHLKYLMMLKISKREDVEKTIEMLFAYLLNQKESIDLAVINEIQSEIERLWLSSLSYSSDYSKELKALLQKNLRARAYPKERINAQNFAKHIGKAFDTFSYNLGLYSSFQPKFPSIFQMKSMLELMVIQNFVDSFADFSSLIDDEKNRPIYLDQIKEALMPIEQKLLLENQKLITFIQSEGALIRHTTLKRNSVLYPIHIRPFILDRL